MKFSNRFFNKEDIKLVTEQDLEDIIIRQLKEGSLESLSFELKSFKAVERIRKHYDKITKYVVALANNDKLGGILILGVDELNQELTPFSLDKDKDSIARAINERLLNPDPRTIEVHVINSQKSLNRNYVIIEVVNDLSYPYYWSYVPKTEIKGYFPFVKKTEEGVKKIHQSEIHEIKDLSVEPYCPRNMILVDPSFILKNFDYPLYRIPNIELGVENVGRHPITNCQIKIMISSRFLTDVKDIYWIFNSHDHKEISEKSKKLEEILTREIGKPIKVRYTTMGEEKGENIEITLDERFDLAQSQIYMIKLPLYVEVARFSKSRAEPEVLLTSNETGRLNFKVPLIFINRGF